MCGQARRSQRCAVVDLINVLVGIAVRKDPLPDLARMLSDGASLR